MFFYIAENKYRLPHDYEMKVDTLHINMCLELADFINICKTGRKFILHLEGQMDIKY